MYIKEAHALDSASPMSGGNAPVVQEPVTLEERLGLARQCTAALGLERLPTLVDEISDGVGTAYEGWPDRLYLVGLDGRISYAGGRGPRGFKPDELATAIEKALGQAPTPAGTGSTETPPSEGGDSGH